MGFGHRCTFQNQQSESCTAVEGCSDYYLSIYFTSDLTIALSICFMSGEGLAPETLSGSTGINFFALFTVQTLFSIFHMFFCSASSILCVWMCMLS